MADQEITCRGSIMLGSGCGTCSKCEKEIKDMRKKLGEVNKKPPEPQIPVAMPGWACPRCGRGNAPFSSVCPCVPFPPPQVTC